MKDGAFVYIKDGERLIPGKVVSVDGDIAGVLHYGPPHHFQKNYHRFGVYKKEVNIEDLEHREPNLEDPMEFL